MLKSIFATVFFVITMGCGSFNNSNVAIAKTNVNADKPLAKYVILLSIDGLNPEWYLNNRWPAPTFQQLAREGTYAERVRGIFPSLTFPSHITLVTGALPDRHGVLSNGVFTPGQSNIYYSYANQIKVKTLWDVVRESGGTSAAFNWPVSVGGNLDFNIGDIWSTDPTDKLDLSHVTAQPKGYVEELGRKVLGELGIARLRHHENAGPIASYMIEQYQPNLLLIHVSNMDAAQHRHGREHLNVHKTVAFADVLLNRMLESLERAGILDETAVIVTGDHGFSDISLRVQPNTWLVEAGLRENDLTVDNWRATFYTAGASAFLRLRDPNDVEALRMVEDILNSRPESTQQFYKVLDRSALTAIGADPDAPLALAAIDGVSFTDGTTGNDIISGSGGTHGHLSDMVDRMHTGFIAWGAGVRKGGVIPILRMVDIGPTVAELLGLKLPDATGIVHPGVLSQE